ncbi:MAG: rod shape-determining protein MreC, partial [Actinobacteria bacterium]|nr:rod shape-determining protein MreC [Actinomycetota bacterium]
VYQRKRARILLAVLVLVTLILVTVDFRSGGAEDDGILGTVRGAATAVLGPVQEGLAAVIRPVGGAFSGIGDLFSLRSENERLAARLAELEDQRESFVDLERQNAELRGLLDMRERMEFEVEAARVVALAPSNYEWTVTLDVGTAQGIERDMVVINGDGLVGRIIQTTTNASRVLLAIDPNFSAASRVGRIGETGLIDGQGGDLMRFRPLDPEVEIRTGDEIVTSSYSNSIFPPGIPIGSVESVGEASTLLNRDVLVRPYVDFTRLDLVLVVKNAPVVEPPPVADDIDAPFTPPVIPPSPTPEPSSSPGAAATGTETEDGT